MSFKTLAKVQAPVSGTLRVAVDENGLKSYKFIGEKALTLGEILEVIQSVGEPAPERVTAVVTQRSGYKFKTVLNA